MGCEMIHCVDGSISCELMELHTAACTAVACSGSLPKDEPYSRAEAQLAPPLPAH